MAGVGLQSLNKLTKEFIRVVIKRDQHRTGTDLDIYSVNVATGKKGTSVGAITSDGMRTFIMTLSVLL